MEFFFRPAALLRGVERREGAQWERGLLNQVHSVDILEDLLIVYTIIILRIISRKDFCPNWAPAGA